MKCLGAPLLLVLAAITMGLPVFGVAAGQGKRVIGAVEEVWLVPWGITVRARVDTGAKLSSIDARDIEVRPGSPAQIVGFTLVGDDGRRITTELPLAGFRKVKASEGEAELRPTVRIEVCQGREVVARHPDTQQAVSGIGVPHWPSILEIAARGYEMTGLGYLGVDLVLDRERGPVLLELNARPGLAIQLANQDGLERRLRLVDAALVGDGALSVAGRIALARSLFG